MVGVLLGVAVLGGCKSDGGGPPPAPPDPVWPLEDPVWAPDEAAAAIAEAAADAAQLPGADRSAVIERATAEAVEMAMLVAPDLGIDPLWADAMRAEIGKGVTASGGGGVVVDGAVIQEKVRARTLEWIRSH